MIKEKKWNRFNHVPLDDKMPGSSTDGDITGFRQESMFTYEEKIPTSDLLLEDNFIQKERLGWLKSSMEKLPTRDREVLFSYLKGAAQNQIGANIGMSQANVSKIIKSCIQDLQVMALQIGTV